MTSGVATSVDVTSERWLTAVHEAGHVIVARALKIRVHSASVVSDELSEGHVVTTISFDGRRAHRTIQVLLAGAIAEQRLSRSVNEIGDAFDRGTAAAIAAVVSRNAEERRALLALLHLRTTALVERYWSDILIFAGALDEVQQMDAVLIKRFWSELAASKNFVWNLVNKPSSSDVPAREIRERMLARIERDPD